MTERLGGRGGEEPSVTPSAPGGAPDTRPLDLLAGLRPAVDVERLEDGLAGAVLLGLELDPRYRVLAATLEPAPDRDPWGERADRRVQLLCHPVSTILGALEQAAASSRVIRTFDVAQLPDVVSAFEGPTLVAPLFGRPEPRPGEWGPEFSVQGRSTAGDGTRCTVTFDVASGDLRLRVFARFDDLTLHDAAGEALVG